MAVSVDGRRRVTHFVLTLEAGSVYVGPTQQEAGFVRQVKPGTPERGYANALVTVQDDATLPLKLWGYSHEEAIIDGQAASGDGDQNRDPSTGTEGAERHSETRTTLAVVAVRLAESLPGSRLPPVAARSSGGAPWGRAARRSRLALAARTTPTQWLCEGWL